MGSDERIRKYLEAGTVLGEVSRRRVEQLVHVLVDAGLSATREVSAQAGRTVEGVRGTAGRTASRARVAASKVTPTWSPIPGGSPPEKAAS